MDYQRRPSFTKFIGVGILLTFLVLLAFGMTRWFDVPAGNLVDWMIGIASAWWLLVVVTIPWNVYFQARAIVADAAQSINDAIAVQPGSWPTPSAGSNGRLAAQLCCTRSRPLASTGWRRAASARLAMPARARPCC